MTLNDFKEVTGDSYLKVFDTRNFDHQHYSCHEGDELPIFDDGHIYYNAEVEEDFYDRYGDREIQTLSAELTDDEDYIRFIIFLK